LKEKIRTTRLVSFIRSLDHSLISNIFLKILIYAYGFSIMFWHLKITDIFTADYNTPFGIFNPKKQSAYLSIVFAGLFLGYIVYKFVKGKRRLITVLYFILLFELLLADYFIFCLHPVEFVHFIQYTLFTCGLAYVYDRHKTEFAFTKILAIAIPFAFFDETMYYYLMYLPQQLVDFNDVYLNFQGIALGLLIYYGFYIPPDNFKKKLAPVYSTTAFEIYSVIILFIVLMMNFGYLAVTPDKILDYGSVIKTGWKQTFYLERIPGFFASLQHHFLEGYYYVLTPLQTVILVAVLGFLFSTFDPRFIKRFSLKKRIKIDEER